MVRFRTRHLESFTFDIYNPRSAFYTPKDVVIVLALGPVEDAILVAGDQASRGGLGDVDMWELIFRRDVLVDGEGDDCMGNGLVC